MTEYFTYDYYYYYYYYSKGHSGAGSVSRVSANALVVGSDASRVGRTKRVCSVNCNTLYRRCVLKREQPGSGRASALLLDCVQRSARSRLLCSVSNFSTKLRVVSRIACASRSVQRFTTGLQWCMVSSQSRRSSLIAQQVFFYFIG